MPCSSPVVITGGKSESAIAARGQLFDNSNYYHINIFKISKINSEMRGGDAAAVDVPEFKKAFTWMITDGGGHILFRMRTRGFRVGPSESVPLNQPAWCEPLEIKVFNSSLAYRGRMVTSHKVTTMFGLSFGTDALWLVQEGEAGEQYLVK